MIPVFTAVPRGKSVAKALAKAGRATTSILTKLTDKSPASVRDALTKLHRQGKIHIGDYELSPRGKVTRIWYWGDGDDAREPVVAKDRSTFIPRPDAAAAWLRNPI
jgi:hypothetical protein